jgi:imidazolonepropionase-like amidohydrolase/glyoxylase-like metal-dependent hydrolase (beta-lactamase superfamily II)
MTTRLAARLSLTAVAVSGFVLSHVQRPAPNVELARLADGVYAALRKEPLSLAVNSNSLIVVGDSNVLVVDAQFTREATLETIAAIRSVTRKPVRYVVNTHWHDDHVAGNHVYRDSFPSVEFVMHANTRADLAALGGPNREATKEGAPPLADRFSKLLGMGLGIDSTPASEKEREAVASALRIMRQYLSELPTFRLAAEGPEVQDRMTLRLGKRAVNVLWFGRANTRGDLVIHVPSEGIVATGDLVVHPVPFGFNSYPREWIPVLDSIVRLRPRAIVPGHGPVMRDLAYVQRVRAMLGEVVQEAAVATDRGDSLAKSLRSITLDQHRRDIAGTEKWGGYLFTQFFLRPSVMAAVQQRRDHRGALAPGVLAIVNVKAIPMTSDTVIRDATVLVRDGRIAAVGRNVVIPAGARRVDGRGRYLIPGLADMHTHLYSDEDAVPDTAGPAELGVMVANGVTTARLMIGTPEHLVLRRAVAAGDIVGPQLWVASPHLVGRQMPNGIVVTNEEEARAAVRQVAEARYDAVKITLFITRPVYDAIIDEAATRRIRVVGHVDPQVGVPRALETGQQIEHLDSYFEAVLADTAPSRTSLTQQYVFNPKNWASLDYIDDRKIAQIAGATARARTWSSPTLNVFNKAFADRETDEEIRSRPDWNMMPPGLRAGYLQARERYWSEANLVERTETRRKRYVDVRNRLVKAIHDSGGKILAGSDTPEWFHAYGWGLHRELQALVKAGLTPYEALVAATRNPAEFLNQSSEWGTLSPGARADLVLLEANPLEEIGNTMKIAAVAIGGRWLERAELDRLIAAGTRAIDGAAP